MASGPAKGKFVLAVAVVVVLAVVGLVTLVRITEQARDTAIARLRERPSLKTKRAALASGEQSASAMRGREPESPSDRTKERVEFQTHVFTRLQDLSAASKFLLARKPEQRSAEEQAQLDVFLRRHQDLIREIRRLAQLGRPAFPLDFRQGHEMKLPHLSPLYTCARMLGADAVLKANEGNYAEAVDDILAGMKLADSLADEPVLASQGVRIAMYAVLEQDARNVFKPGDLSSELAERLITHAAQADCHDEFAVSLLGEAELGLRRFDDARADTRQDAADPFEQATYWFYAMSLGRAWINMDERTYADTVARIAEASQPPYHEARATIDHINSEVENLPANAALSRQMLPQLTGALHMQAFHEAALDLIQIGLTLEQYYVTHGCYPETLDTIAPDLGGSVPRDPFTGEAYRYRVLGNQFVLYSVGQDLADDGGEHDPQHGDIVWRGNTQ